MGKLDDILTTNIVTYDGGDKLVFSVDSTKQQIKDLILEIIDDTVIGLGGDVPYGELTNRIEEL